MTDEEIQRNELGQFTKRPSTTVPFTKENAAEMQKRGVAAKLERQRVANESAMVTAIEYDQALTDLSPEQGAALIVAKQTIKAISPDLPGSTGAARFVMQETGRSQERQTFQAGRTQGQVDMAALLVAALGMEQDTRAVDAEWQEKTPHIGGVELGEGGG